MKLMLKDPDIFRLFENTFPNTLGLGLQCERRGYNNKDF